jgi:hypothetical protein
MSDEKKIDYTFQVLGEIILTHPDDFDADETTAEQAIQDALGHTGFVVERASATRSQAHAR